MSANPARMPVLFIGHGSPMNAIEDNQVVRRWRELGAGLTGLRAILCISAHWQTRGSALTAMAQPRTIHDFRGFPPALYEVRYDAPGSPALALRVAELLAPTEVAQDQSWGLDHGTWSVLVHLRAAADVPVVQLSMDLGLAPAQHYELAQRLAPLRDEGVLILGSGNVVHNLSRMNWSASAPPEPWARRFDAWVAARLSDHDHDALKHFTSQGDDARLSVPTPEHYLPLLYCLAVEDASDAVDFPVETTALATISMRSVRWTPGAAR
jgi:4,5-DOPA dioxygenase extradiol